ncbi:hypothetical protein [Streptococcus sp. NLN76]|uniref:hypothetical protein n=1 Tax=Streptococcus sp. NLN76 TaxID=2822800 RepID=UPI0018A9D02B|nr:hypothetical protein [Streptococcus sp. NLN76]MBF8970196.1 hypothetical protein [Streptococcus sp. NLN76]
MKSNKIVEYNDSIFINGVKIPFVLKDSIKLSADDEPIITLSIVVSEYRRVFNKSSSEEQSEYNFDN